MMSLDVLSRAEVDKKKEPKFVKVGTETKMSLSSLSLTAAGPGIKASSSLDNPLLISPKTKASAAVKSVTATKTKLSSFEGPTRLGLSRPSNDSLKSTILNRPSLDLATASDAGSSLRPAASSVNYLTRSPLLSQLSTSCKRPPLLGGLATKSSQLIGDKTLTKSSLVNDKDQKNRLLQFGSRHLKVAAGASVGSGREKAVVSLGSALLPTSTASDKERPAIRREATDTDNRPNYQIKLTPADTDDYSSSNHQNFSAFTSDIPHSLADDINEKKVALLHAMSSALIGSPDFHRRDDATRQMITKLADEVIPFDPEFILKAALFTRKELYIRSAANFLLALAALNPPCRTYLKKYFNNSVALPSDWIEVAEIYQTFHDNKIKYGSLPTSLRKAMAVKFPDFDKYQLAKYNKDKTKKTGGPLSQWQKIMLTLECTVELNLIDQPYTFQIPSNQKPSVLNHLLSAEGDFLVVIRDWESFILYRQPTKSLEDEKIKLIEMNPIIEALAGKKFSTGGEVVKSIYKNMKREKSLLSELDEMRLKNPVFSKGMLLNKGPEEEEDLAKMTFNMKQLIRKLHITEPVDHVMSLIGKKYPEDLDSFYSCRLPGTWDPDRAGQRMKLPTPETWETQVTLKGNKSSTWEQLLDNKKLPFMAMLRNLRNMILTGISRKHHQMVLKKLQDERTVINSKQFPFRFFSAYEVLNEMENHLSDVIVVSESGEKPTPPPPQKATNTTTRGKGKAKGKGKGPGKSSGEMTREEFLRKKMNQIKSKFGIKYDLDLLAKYRKALDSAVKISTSHNVKPISGRTLILLNMKEFTRNMPCKSAKGLGKPKSMLEVSSLLALMCKYACEECHLVGYQERRYGTVRLAENETVLHNLDRLLNDSLVDWNCESGEGSDLDIQAPMSYLQNILVNKTQFDSIVVLPQATEFEELNSFRGQYRATINPDMLFVYIRVFEKKTRFAPGEVAGQHPNDIYLSGFSDQMLRFIAERGSQGQLVHVEGIDQLYNLRPIKAKTAPSSQDSPQRKEVSPQALPQTLSRIRVPKWRTVRVFISSTFQDMHGERDLLTRFVFPELRSRAKQHHINVYEVDLRWGISQEQTKDNKSLEICLREASKCDLFVGILGERYGWVPDNYTVPPSDEFDWLADYPPQRSVTELEMQQSALSQPDNDTTFFYLRDSSFFSEIPKEWKKSFVTESSHAKERIKELKERIRSSGLEVFDNYPCGWGGVVDGKPISGNLQEFGVRVLNNLWNAILKKSPQPHQDLEEDEVDIEIGLHQAYADHHLQGFTGRDPLLRSAVGTVIRECSDGVVTVCGKPGCGKSAIMAELWRVYRDQMSSHCTGTLGHFVGATPQSTDIAFTIRRLSVELSHLIGRQQSNMADNYKDLVAEFWELLKLVAATLCQSTRLMIFIDGLDLLSDSHLAKNLEWLPKTVPKGVVFILSCQDGGQCHKALQRQSRLNSVIGVGALATWEQPRVIRSTLQLHSKTLDESPFNNQMKLLLSKREANSPLYLSLACQELRVFGVFEKVSERLKKMAQTVSGLLQEMLIRMEEELGENLIRSALLLLLSSRKGLTEEELHSLLSLKSLLEPTKFTFSDVKNVCLSPDQLLPPLLIAQLINALHGFLRPQTKESSNQLSLAYSEVNRAVEQRYLKASGSNQLQQMHTLLAGFFYLEADPDRSGGFAGSSQKALSELPHHLAQAGLYSDLELVLANLHFVAAKLRLGLLSQLMDDFRGTQGTQGGSSGGSAWSRLQAKEQQKLMNKASLKDFRSFISGNAHVLGQFPSLVWQQAINEPSASTVSQAAAKMVASKSLPPQSAGLVWLNKPISHGPCIMTISSLSKSVNSVALSNSGETLACATGDGSLRLCEASTGKELKALLGHADVVTDCCFVGPSKVCSASADGTLSLWDVQQGYRIQTLKGHTRRVSCCASDPKGALVASASWDFSVRVWSATTGGVVAEFKDSKPFNCVAFRGDGDVAIGGNWRGVIKVWSITAAKQLAALKGHSSSVRAVGFSPNGHYIASAALNGEILLWSAFANSYVKVGCIVGHSQPVNRLAFTHNNASLITVGNDHTVKVWSSNLGKPVKTLGKSENMAATCVAFSPWIPSVAVGYHSGCVRLFDTVSGKLTLETAQHQLSLTSLTWVRNANRDCIVTASHDSKILMTDVQDGGEGQVTCLEGYSKPVVCVAATTVQSQSQTLYIAATSDDIQMLIWHVARCHLKKDDQTRYLTACMTAKGPNRAPLHCCAFSQGGGRLAAGSKDCLLLVWDLELVGCSRGQSCTQSVAPCRVVETTHTDWVTSCAWSNLADHILVTGSSDCTIRIWDLNKEAEKAVLQGHDSPVTSVRFKCGCIVSSSSDGSVKVWSQKGVEITTLQDDGAGSNVTACDIRVEEDKTCAGTNESVQSSWASQMDQSELEGNKEKSALKRPPASARPEDVLVVTSNSDATCTLWRPLQANAVCTLTGHSDRVVGVATSVTDSQVWTSSRDGHVKLWDCRQSIGLDHEAEVTCTQFSPDGVLALTASRDGVLKVWRVSDEGSTQLQPLVMYSEKVDEKGISCLNFVARRIFVTASYSGSLASWSIDEQQQISKIGEMAVGSPLTCMDYDPSSGLLAVGQWQNRVLTYKLAPTDEGIFKFVSDKPLHQWSLEPSTVWIKEVKLVRGQSSNPRLLTLDGAGTVSAFDTNKEKCTASFKAGEDCVSTLGGLDGDQLLSGSHKGQLCRHHFDGKDFKKAESHNDAHCSPLSGVCLGSRFLSTIADDDAALKLWEPSTVNQIGHFICKSAITSLDSATLRGNRGLALTNNRIDEVLVCGDKLGNVYFLKWLFE